MADTDVVATGTSTPLLTPHAFPVDENSLRPQLMEPVVLAKVLVTAVVRADHLVVQTATPSQLASAAVL
jgi:hypothetical protein